MSADQSLEFEAALSELEQLAAAMERGDMPLSQSLEAYRRGVDLAQICQQRLDEVEQQVQVLEQGLLRPLAVPAAQPSL